VEPIARAGDRADPARRLSRRRFLSGLGAAGGAAAVTAALVALDRAPAAAARPAPYRRPRAADFTLQGRANEGHVVVIGAGIAGLGAAHELLRAGYDVTVVEAAARVGGRNWTVRNGTVYADRSGETQRCTFEAPRWLNAGPARIAQHHTTLEYCRDLDVPVEVFVNANVDAFVEQDGTVRRRRSVVADLDGYIAELLTKAMSTADLDGEISDAEANGVLDHLRTVGALGRSDRGYDRPPGVDAGSVGTPDELDLLLGLGIAPRLAFDRDWHQAMPMFHPVGGMDRLVDAFVAAVGPARIRTSAPVARIERTLRGVRVGIAPAAGGATDTIEADWGICTIPPHLAAELPNPWPLDVRRALREPVSTGTGKIGLEYDRRFWEEDDRILGGITTTAPDTRVIWYPSTGYLGAGGVLVGAYPFGPEGDAFGRLSHAQREQLALERGEAIHGAAYRDELVSSFSVDWGSVDRIEGAWSTFVGHGSGYRRLLRPTGRWFFAGDWLSHATGWQHGALESARHAVTTLHEAALAQ